MKIACRFLLPIAISMFTVTVDYSQPKPLSDGINGFVSLAINQYDTAHFNRISNKQIITASAQTVKVNNSTWSVQFKSNPANADYYDCYATFKCLQGQLHNAAVSVQLNLNQWSKDNYVLMPAAVYNGNRYPYRRLRYSPKLYEVQDIGIDKPIIVTDIPKLNDTVGISRIQEISGDMACPAIGYFSPSQQKNVWLLTEQENQYGNYGLSIEENAARNKATITLTSPVVREEYVYKICDNRFPSWDKPADFKAGDVINIHFRIYIHKGNNLQSLFNEYAAVRKALNQHQLINTIPYAAVMQVMEKKFNQYNYVPQHGYYSVGLRENYLQDWQIGWTGGMISTYPLLMKGNDTTIQHVINNFNWLFPKGIAPSGFYYDAGRNGTEWIGGDIRKPHTKNWHLVRKSGDAVWYIIKQFMLMEQKGIAVKQSWKDGNEKVCKAFVQLWNQYHQLGQFVNSETGEIVVGGSSSGAIVPAALSLAAAYYHNENYLTAAKEIAAYYYQNFTAKGITCGGPGDALQNLDSESSEAMMESFVTLYEQTKDIKWLQYAEEAAKQFATWVVSYDYRFKDTTAYAKANMHTTGSVYANTQNKHTAPGICTASGIGLLKLYQYTHNPFYMELLQDIAHNITQYVSQPQHPLGNMPYGFVSERVNMGDWEGPETIGYILPMSTWAETSLMLTATELPGVVLEASKNKITVLDNIEASIIASDNTTITVQFKNPTPFDTQITVLELKQQILGENLLHNSSKISLPKATIITVSFKK